MATAGSVTVALRKARFGAGAARLRAALSGPAVALVPGALTVFLAFQSGGYYPGATAFAAVLLTLLLLARVLLSDDPFAGVSVPLAVVAGALMLLAAWTLASAQWSDSSGRAMLEFDRVLVYLLALLLMGSLPRTSATGRWLLYGLAVGMTFVCAAGLTTRLLPDIWSAPPEVERQRLSYPVGYWNAFGLLASLALVFCLHLTSSAREPRTARILAAAAMPVLGAALLFTFSRGAIVIAVVGLLAYMLLGRPRLLLTGLLGAALPTGIAVLASYHADLLAKFELGRGFAAPTRPVIEQGQDVAVTVGLCVLGAALLRALAALALDPGLERLRARRRTRTRLTAAAAALTATGLAVAVWAATSGDWLDKQWERVVSDPVTQTGDFRDRLFNPGLERTDRWDVATAAFAEDRLKGHGAGTYRLLWEQDRPNYSISRDAHSLYLETLSELGLVGLVLLAVVLLSVLGGFAARLRGRDRTLHAAFLAAGLMWAVHAAIDWDWELPAITLWLFAAGGVALAAPKGARRAWNPTVGVRVAVAAGLLLVAVTPARLGVADARLADSVQAYDNGRCVASMDAARKSSSILGNRPEAYEVLAYCEARTRAPNRGIRSMEEAVDRDPRNWDFHYGLALVRALAGVDPLPAARAALRLNPREPRARGAVRRFRTRNRRAWRRAARKLRLSPREPRPPTTAPADR